MTPIWVIAIGTIIGNLIGRLIYDFSMKKINHIRFNKFIKEYCSEKEDCKVEEILKKRGRPKKVV